MFVDERDEARTSIGKTLRTLIERYLAQFLFENACFLGERLYAHEKTAESLNLLAHCYMRADKYYRAYQVLQKGINNQADVLFNQHDSDHHHSDFDDSKDQKIANEGDFSPEFLAKKYNHKQLEQVNKSNRYLLAKCCYSLGKFREAEAALLKENSELRLNGPHKCGVDILSNPECLDSIPNGAAGLYLLGLICVKDNRREHAIDYFTLSLKLDPFLWDSYERLCALGAEIPPTAFFGDDRNAIYAKELFGDDVPELFGQSHRAAPVRAPLPLPTKATGVASIFPPQDYEFVASTYVDSHTQNQNQSTVGPLQERRTRSRQNRTKSSQFQHNISSVPLLQLTPTDRQFGWPTPAPIIDSKSTHLNISGNTEPTHENTSSLSPPITRSQARNIRGRKNSNTLTEQHAATPTGVRRSTRQQARYFHNSINAQTLEKDENENDDSENTQIGVSVGISNGVVVTELGDSLIKKSPNSSPELPETPEDSSAIAGSQGVLALLRVLGEGLLLLSQYRCLEARVIFSKLPPEQHYTGWVLHHMGKAAFEMADYRVAQESFEKMRLVAPSRTAGLEVYSTNLWHLKEEVALCYLAQQAVEMDKKSPEAWCVIGNCFSLQKEHDVAIKFFQRALQLDPNFTYAYTLSGHEYVSNEDFEKAVACYRHAIRTDSRHYNAWYGLGTIYFRQEKYELAEYHFRRALAINSRSSVLYCYLGMVLHESRKYEVALKMLQYATELEPSNPQAKFQRANVLRTMECYEAALEELMSVRDSAPREASVHFLMGKICKQLGRRDEAMIHFTTALDLDPKDSNMIKLSIDKLDSSDIDEEDDL